MDRRLNSEVINSSYTNTQHINCMGYALDIPDWLYVTIQTNIDHDLAKFGYTPCAYEDIIPGKFEGIAYRYCEDDWHFVYIGSDGSITHKPGRTPVRRMSVDDLLNPVGWLSPSGMLCYDSPISFYRREVKS